MNFCIVFHRHSLALFSFLLIKCLLLLFIYTVCVEAAQAPVSDIKYCLLTFCEN